MSDQKGFAESGDVRIFYRKLGTPGATPILVFHGGNYYDSADWIEVATALSQDREVAIFNSRGFGESGWSASKDYSHAAHIADAVAVLNQLGWKSVIAVGHSRGGAYALLFAARFPERTDGLVIIDYCPGFGIGPRGMPVVNTQSIGHAFTVFADASAALASTSRFKFAPHDESRRLRFDSLLRRADGGVIIAKRDPDFANQVSTAASRFSLLQVGDMWAELRNARAPALVFRALKSKAGYDDEDVERLRREFSQIKIIDIDSDHDVVAEAPQALVSGIKGWLATADRAEAGAMNADG